ncbi:hypothetical protein PoB_005885600 [Plakobranchus ocellatus]|uniref:Uncharacterized protein n=1 Tax=Plakobranchus ocellatus TaxID=259542 RepID=A0AAV4CAN1_9GAST|nr:hypothetical protein PoB_005885600 [Plakobranchus ocellatus]
MISAFRAFREARIVGPLQIDLRAEFTYYQSRQFAVCLSTGPRRQYDITCGDYSDHIEQRFLCLWLFHNKLISAFQATVLFCKSTNAIKSAGITTANVGADALVIVPPKFP